MSSPVDPNDVMMTGENSFVRLSHDGGKTLEVRGHIGPFFRNQTWIRVE